MEEMSLLWCLENRVAGTMIGSTLKHLPKRHNSSPSADREEEEDSGRLLNMVCVFTEHTYLTIRFVQNVSPFEIDHNDQ